MNRRILLVIPLTLGIACTSGVVARAAAPLHVAAAPNCSAPAAPGVDWSGCNKREFNLHYHKLIDAKFVRTNFVKATLSAADLSGADLTDADLERANLTSAQLHISQSGRQTILQSAHMELVDARGAHFTGADLDHARLDYADLRRAKLTRVNLRHAVLGGARFSDAVLQGVDFTGANLDGAHQLFEAELDGITWNNTICPDGTNSDHHGNTCHGHLTP